MASPLGSGWRNDRLRAAAGSGVRERFGGAGQRETGADETLQPELRHEGERPREGSAAAEGAVDADLAEVNVPEVERQVRALGVDADQLHDARGLDHRHGL